MMETPGNSPGQNTVPFDGTDPSLLDGSSLQPSTGMPMATDASVVRDHSGHAHRDPALKNRENFTHIQGWGADLDHKNRPAYPMERTPPRLPHPPSGRPEDQPVRMKVYHSTERPGLTPIFGTSTPPSGLSGLIRDVAYKMSENDIRHWLLLMMADRVNMVEGIGQDLMRGHVPNIFAEMGIKSEWKYNRRGLIRKAAITTAIVGGVGYYLLKRKKDRDFYHTELYR